jgi:hypothetical protein
VQTRLSAVVLFHMTRRRRRSEAFEDPAGVAVEGGAAVAGQVAHLRTVVLVGRLHLEAFMSYVGRPIYAGY